MIHAATPLAKAIRPLATRAKGMVVRESWGLNMRELSKNTVCAWRLSQPLNQRFRLLGKFRRALLFQQREVLQLPA